MSCKKDTNSHITPWRAPRRRHGHPTALLPPELTMKPIPLISLSIASALLAGPTGAIAADALDLAPKYSVSVTNEEAVGPFASWGNVKTKYGAVGDGVADDTLALQRALDDMNQYDVNKYNWKIERPGSPAVLYFPAGTYRITKTLVSRNQFGASLVGEDPATTTIAWGGAPGEVMLIADGAYGGQYARLTWDGKQKAGIGVAHWWNQKNSTQYGASPVHVDEVFVDMGVGIVAGCRGASSTNTSHPDEITQNNPGGSWKQSDYTQMDSEGSIKRTKFTATRSPASAPKAAIRSTGG